MLPFENFEAFRSYLTPDFKADVDALLQFGFCADGHVLNLRPPISWDGYSRSFQFQLHSWDPISDLLAAHSHLGDNRCLEVAEAFAFDWLKVYQEPILTKSPADVVAAASAASEECFVWYDMAIGVRIYRLAYLAETIVRRGSRSAEDRRLLVEALRFHHQVLANPVIFRGHTNHGLYQALGQLAASRRLTDILPSEAFEGVARRRLYKCLSEHFFVEEGVHGEHSPGYHSMVLGTLLGAREAGLLSPKDDDLLLRAEEALMWMTMPNSSLAPIGDTDRWLLREAGLLADRYRYAPLHHVLTGGGSGEPPPAAVRAYPTAGYAFARIYDREGGASPTSASYLAQLSAYHSRVHKHADHLTFVWSEGPLEILTDSGRFGYLGRTVRGDGLYEQGFWYADPARVYVESTRAHNCVEVDKRSYPRLKTGIFGSALKQADLQDGIVVFDSSMVLRPSLLCRRTLLLSPGEFLLVVDWLFDRTGTPHDFDQWFQLAAGWSVEQVGNGYLATQGATSLHVVDLLGNASPSTVYLGNHSPLQGWTSLEPGSLTASPSVKFALERTERAAFATLFSLIGAPTREPSTRTNKSMSRAILAWALPGRRVRIDLERQSKVNIRYTVSH